MASTLSLLRTSTTVFSLAYCLALFGCGSGGEEEPVVDGPETNVVTDCPSGEVCADPATTTPTQTLEERRTSLLSSTMTFDIDPDADGSFRTPCADRDVDTLDVDLLAGSYRVVRRQAHAVRCAGDPILETIKPEWTYLRVVRSKQTSDARLVVYQCAGEEGANCSGPLATFDQATGDRLVDLRPSVRYFSTDQAYCRVESNMAELTLTDKGIVFHSAMISETNTGYPDEQSCKADFPKDQLCGDFAYSICGVGLEVEAERL